MGQLTTLRIKSLKTKPGRHSDGDGLYLFVKPSGAQSWVLRLQRDGKRHDIGLGSVDFDGRERDEVRSSDELPILLKRHLTLAEARLKAKELRQFAKAGKDPIVERDRDRTGVPTFSAAVVAAHEVLKSGWSERTGDAFLKSLQTYANPTLGRIRVDGIEASHVRDVLAPIWTTKPDLARKVRVRIGQVLNFSHSKGWRTTDAPRKSVSVGLPKQPTGGNYKAMPYVELPGFAQALLEKTPTSGRRALLFMILTAARPGEVRNARWKHIDFENENWIRPAELMKLKKDHTVTLCAPALRLLKEARGITPLQPDDLIFPGQGGKVMSDMSLTKVLRDAQIKYDAHGFRSTFRDWAAEKMPDIPDPVAEAALAHAVPDTTVRAYKRTPFIELRRQLLAAWGTYVLTEDAPGMSAERVAANRD